MPNNISEEQLLFLLAFKALHLFTHIFLSSSYVGSKIRSGGRNNYHCFSKTKSGVPLTIVHNAIYFKRNVWRRVTVCRPL